MGAVMNAMLECSNRDIAAAGMWQDQIKRILKAHQQGERNDAMAQDLKVLCICIIHTIRDPYCQEKMCEVAIHSDKLFAVDERAGRSMLPIFLRRLIFKSLQAFGDRLRAIETARQSEPK
jgi:hypothetical protein